MGRHVFAVASTWDIGQHDPGRHRHEREKEKLKKEYFERWCNNERFTQADKVRVRLLSCDLSSWVLEWERGKQMKWKPVGIWDLE